jgi:hypothetical protein
MARIPREQRRLEQYAREEGACRLRVVARVIVAQRLAAGGLAVVECLFAQAWRSGSLDERSERLTAGEQGSERLVEVCCLRRQVGGKITLPRCDLGEEPKRFTRGGVAFGELAGSGGAPGG